MEGVTTKLHNEIWKRTICKMTIKKHVKMGLSVLAISVSLSAFAKEDPIKVGVLHSLSGTMAISETALKDTILMLIEKQNAEGGVLGRKLEPVVVDPASNWPLFAEKARELLARKKWT